MRSMSLGVLAGASIGATAAARRPQPVARPAAPPPQTGASREEFFAHAGPPPSDTVETRMRAFMQRHRIVDAVAQLPILLSLMTVAAAKALKNGRRDLAVSIAEDTRYLGRMIVSRRGGLRQGDSFARFYSKNVVSPIRNGKVADAVYRAMYTALKISHD